jgi:hypothetical protein
MKTTEANSFGAENTISEVLANNKLLLDTQIEPSTIISLIDLCLTQPKHERFLNLLSGICSCNGEAISANQDNIVITIMDNPATKQAMLFPIVVYNEQLMVMVKDNLQEESVEAQEIFIKEFYSSSKERGDMRMYNYFLSLISLCASICHQRNYKGVKALEQIYPLNVVIDCTLDSKLENKLRAQFTRLLISLHMDKDPLEKLNIPVMTRVWDEVTAEIIQLP